MEFEEDRVLVRASDAEAVFLLLLRHHRIDSHRDESSGGLMVGPSSQLSAFAKTRAQLVLPVPRGPTKR